MYNSLVVSKDIIIKGVNKLPPRLVVEGGQISEINQVTGVKVPVELVTSPKGKKAGIQYLFKFRG